ncbi:hypothetical protein [Pedobacter rhizosphaerae]|uniref:hypothetical protein n=1 Tax=Pedobacter rhizosphaerae TaxID=390241 RepID=UPI001113FEA8|nr:hypothetical protein [Pedobacter rhizosphaerae]
MEKIEKHIADDLDLWKLPNLIHPLMLVGISMIGFCLFKDPKQVTLINVINLLVNGSLPMFAFNRMSSLSTNLFKTNKSEEEKAKTRTYSIRVKINDWSKLLIFLIGIFYVFQVTKTPFNCLPSILFVQIPLTALMVWCSVTLSRDSFLLQEQFITSTFADLINDGAKEDKKHLQNKYGEEDNG